MVSFNTIVDEKIYIEMVFEKLANLKVEEFFVCNFNRLLVEKIMVPSGSNTSILTLKHDGRKIRILFMTAVPQNELIGEFEITRLVSGVLVYDK